MEPAREGPLFPPVLHRFVNRGGTFPGEQQDDAGNAKNGRIGDAGGGKTRQRRDTACRRVVYLPLSGSFGNCAGSRWPTLAAPISREGERRKAA